mmetsp:Transcript_13467/g.18820  ORF Transcript_13467/g.18820 Transcript_13467/m.18820 type:complete len:206 (-) Transcript_13467:558-1175(-)
MRTFSVRPSFQPNVVVEHRNRVLPKHSVVVVEEEDHACEVLVDHHHDHVGMDDAVVVVVHLDRTVEDNCRTLVEHRDLHLPYLVGILEEVHHDIPVVVVVVLESPNIAIAVDHIVVVAVVVVEVHDCQMVDHGNLPILPHEMVVDCMVLLLDQQQVVVAMEGWRVLHDPLVIQTMIHVLRVANHKHYHRRRYRKNSNEAIVSRSY